MRENNRNSIASIEKFPQFTTMHVIDGQAGLIICASLIFYSLTIDNILNIIVLLILAGISIQMLTGDNGILTKAAEAKENTEQSQLEEQRRLASMEAATNLTETVYNDGEKEIKIPSGFAPTGIEGENTVEDGLVITDSKGNEFVWVEVPNDGTGPDYTGVEENNNIDFLKIAKALAIYSSSTLSNNPTSLADHLPPADKVGKDYTNEYKDVLKSIYQNGGFWVGRYETGIQGTENATTSARDFGTDYSTEHPTEGNVAVIKENVQPYRWVRWGQAQTLVQGFLPATNNSNHANLLMGVQWDLVLKFLGKSGDTDSHEWGNYRDSVFSLKPGSHYAKYSSSTLSTTWKAYNEDEAGFVEASEKKGLESGNGILYTTGANITQNSIKNICDIAGNVWEWTIERTSGSSKPCSIRGGFYFYTGLLTPASLRLYYGTSRSYGTIGFRVSLY